MVDKEKTQQELPEERAFLRKRTEEALRLSEERFELAMRGASDGLWDWNLQTDEVYYSPRWKSMLGYAEDELEHHLSTWKRLVHPEDREPTLAFVRNVLDERIDKYEVEFRMRHKDGHYLNILSRAFLVHDAQRNAVRLVGTHLDITERKQVEQALRQSEEFVRNILDSVEEGFLVIDRDYRIITANRAFCTWVEMPCDAMIGRHCYEISHKSLKPCYEEGEECAVRRAFETGEPHMAVHEHEDADGNVLYIESKAYPLRDSSGIVTSAIETIQNITERRLLEAEQLKTQKLEAIGTLAGGIAHDFNNLLQGVFGYMSMAKMNLDRKDKALAMLEQAEKALSLSVNLTGQLLTFAKGGKPVKKRIPLQPVIESSVKFALSGSRSNYNITYAEVLRQVEADKGQIAQVIQNIVLNASEAMPGGGTVEISAGNVEIPPGGNSLLPAGGKFIRIAIKDSGIGIPGHNLLRIFDPYFTTKHKGSGLGLATAYAIVRNHGGVIEVTSDSNKGSTFSIFLPATEVAEVKETPDYSSPASGKGRILVMDDEEMVRDVSMELIEALGHEVECASEGGEAVEKFAQARKSGRPFDIVILDLTVKGGMGGEEAVRKLCQIEPGVKAIVSSGYADNTVVSEYRAYGFAAFLNKPYRIDALRECLDNLLA